MIRTLLTLAILAVVLSPAADAAAVQVSCPTTLPLTMTLNYGDDANTNCALTEVGEIALFTFHGNTNDQIIISLDSSWYNGPCADLYDPTDTLVKSGCGAGGFNGSFDFTLAMTGQYTIRVHDIGYVNTGTFGLMLECWDPVALPSPLTLGLSSNGKTVNGETIDNWTFAGTAKEDVTIQVASTYYNGPCFTLVSPAGVASGIVCGPGGFQAMSEYILSEAGTYTVFVSSIGYGASGTYTVLVQCVASCSPPSLTIAGPASPLPSATVEAAYAPVTFTASGGTGGYTWSQTGLPASTGLSLSGAGVLSGTPASGSQGSYSLTVTVTDSSNNTASKTFQLTINQPSPPIITGPGTPLPSGTVGAAYGPVTFTASGGAGGYTWSQAGLAASTGLSLSSAGVLSGTPASGSQGSYSLTVTVTDSSSNTASGTFQLTIGGTNPAPVTITGPTSPLPAATAGTAYAAVTFSASGGAGGYTWSQTGLAASTGLSLSTGGVLSGTPASGSQGSYTMTVTVTDSSSNKATGTFQLTINASQTLGITSLSPASATVGGPAFNLTVNGSGFLSGAAVQWDGSALSTTYVSASQLTVAVPANQIAVEGGVSVTVVNPGPVTSNAVTFSITPPAGAYDLSSAWSNSSNPNGPWSYNQGSTPLPSEPNWTGAGSTWPSSCDQAAWAPSNNYGNFLPAFFKVDACAATQLNVTNPPTNVAPGDVMVHTVDGFNGNPSLGTADILFTLPASATPGTYTISGSLWDSLSTALSSSRPQDWSVSLNGVQIASGVLSGAVPRSQAQTFSVVEGLNIGDHVELQIQHDAATDSGFFVTMNLTIALAGRQSAPAISGLSPSSAAAGGQGFNLTVNGSGFVSGAKVEWNKSPLTTTYVSGSQLTAAVPASLIATAGSASVTVANPSGPVSNPVTFTISPPATPTISSLSPSSATAGGPPFTLTVNGAGFASGAFVQWNSTKLPTTYFNANQLTAAVPATLITTAGSASVTVANPSGSVSSPATFNINPPTVPTISSLSPTSATAGGPPFTLTVNGAGFASGAFVQWNSTKLPTTYFNANQLTAAVPATLITTAGSASLTVVNPGGLTSSPATLTIEPPVGIFVSPQSLSFTYQTGGSSPAPQTFSVFSNLTSVKYSVTASANWLSVAPAVGQTPGNIVVSLQKLASIPACPGPAACTDTASITIKPTNSAAAPAPVNVTLTVLPAQPQLVVSPQYLTVSGSAGGSSIQRQVQVFNTGGGTLNYTVTASVLPWLTVSCGASGAVTFTSPTAICFTFNPGAVQAGIYHTLVTVGAGSGIQPVVVNVTLQVTQAESLILLSPGAMEFTAARGGFSASQTLDVLNIGTGTMDWVAQASGNWLELSSGGCNTTSQRITGSATSGGPAGSLTVCVDPAVAQVGANYGQITVSVLNGAAGNFEEIAVLLNVLPSGAPLPEQVAPTGVVLQVTAGSNALVPVPVNVTNFNAQAVSFTVLSVMQDGAGWLSTNPENGSLPGGATTPIEVRGTAALLSPGIYHGQVWVGFSDGNATAVNVILVVSPAAGTTSVGESARVRKDHPLASPPNCPGGTVLPPQFVNLSQENFQAQAGTVTQLLVQVKDSCGNPITGSDVGATLSVVIYNSQATLETPNLLYSAAQGLWQYGWTPTSTATNDEVGPVAMYAVAGVGVGDNSIGNRSDIWTGTVTAAAAGSAAQPVTVINAASPDIDNISQYNQVAAGSYISIYGAMLADGTANPYPFPTQAQGTEVLLGGIPLLLNYVSPTQINALVPTTSQLPQYAPLPLKIQRDGTVSVQDLQVSVAAVQPAMYTLDGKQAAALIANTVDIVAPVGSPWGGSRPAQAGVDYLEIYCNGLGPVTNPPKDGQQAGSDPLSWTVTMPTVTIGGVQATPIFWGLSPGSVALYQIDVQVPAGSQTGDAVPIVIQMGSVPSNTAYIAVQ